MNMENIAIYARKGTSLDSKTLDEQVEYCKIAAIKDLRTDESQIDFYIYKDICSGNDFDRAGLQQLFKDIQEKGIKRVYVYNLDRLGRTATGTLDVLLKLRDEGVILVSLKDNINTGSEMSESFFMVLSMMAGLEKECIV